MIEEMRISPYLLFREKGGYRLKNLTNGSMTDRHGGTSETLQACKVQAFDATIDAVGGVGTLELMANMKIGGKLISYGILDSSEMSIALSLT